MTAAAKIRHLREAGMDDAPDQQTTDREDWRARRTMVEHDVLATKALSWTEKGVYIALESHCYAGKNVCWPSVPTLADHTGLTTRSVIKAVASLDKKGWLSRQVGGGTQTTRYVLHGNPHTPEQCSPPTPERDAPDPCTMFTPPLNNLHPKQSKISSPR
jgi:hypothetical protein